MAQPQDPQPATSLPALLAGIDLGAMRARVLLVALKGANRNEADAEDATSFAFEALLDPAHVDWDGSKDLYLYLCDRVADFLSNMRKKRRRRRDGVLDEEIEDETAAPSSRSPTRLVEDKDEQARCWKLLREELEGHRVALGVLDQTLAGVDEPADQARALSVPVAEVYNANKRIQRAMSAVAKKVRT